MRNFEQIGFTATHGCENANNGPFFFWKSGGCDNALTFNSWWHQNFIMEYENTDFMNEDKRIINLFGKKVRVLGIRRLTPTECSRLQTIPTWYKWECSDSQAYRMLGNGWTVEVIKHIFSFLPEAWKA